MLRVTYARIGFLVGLSYAASISTAVWLAMDPRTYFFHTAVQRRAWTVPWLLLTFVCVVMLIESLVVLAALDPRPKGPVWHRMAFGATVLAAWGVPSAIVGSIHAPGFLIWHTLWVWALVAVLFVSMIGTLLMAGVRQLTARREVDGDRAEA
jgi:hypothetical protein